MIVDMTRVTNFIGQALLIECLRSLDIDFIGIGISIIPPQIKTTKQEFLFRTS
jgi:hypothetical protein